MRTYEKQPDNTFEAPNDYRSYLCHYGVKGMKWGQRKEYVPHPRAGGASSQSLNGQASSSFLNRLAKKRAQKRMDKFNKGLERARARHAKKANTNNVSNRMSQQAHQQALQTHMQNTQLHNQIHQQNVQMQMHMHMMGTQNDKSKEVRTEIDKNSLPNWEQQHFKDGYTIENPVGFEEGTTFTYKDYNGYTEKDWEIGDRNDRISISQTDWKMNVFKDPAKEKDRKLRQMNDKQIANLQKSLTKVKSKLQKEAALTIANEMKSIAEEWGGDDRIISKDTKSIAKDIQSEGFSHIRAFGETTPNDSKSVAGEITFFDPYSEHILTKEYTINLDTNEIKLSKQFHSMDG